MDRVFLLKKYLLKNFNPTTNAFAYPDSVFILSIIAFAVKFLKRHSVKRHIKQNNTY
jgi:hypothetical protein